MARDYITEMNALIEADTAGSGWIAAEVAAKLVDRLTANDPDLLDGWLRVMAPGLLTEAIALRVRAARSVARARAGARAFADATEAGAEPVGFLAIHYVVDEADTRMRLADMTGPHCLYVADRYDQQAVTAAMEAAFFRALAGRVGARRVGQVLSGAEVERLRQSITREPDRIAS